MPKFEAAPAPEKEEKFEVFGASRASERHPERNEDAFFVSEKAAGVFDGMGGEKGGDLASRLAIEFCAEAAKNWPANASLDKTRKAMENIVLNAHQEVMKAVEQNPDFGNMGATASLVKIWESPDGQKAAIIVNIGDSRVYIHHAEDMANRLEQVTLDDSKIREITEDEAEARLLQAELSRVTEASQLTDKERQIFGERNEITQCLGGRMKKIKPQVYVRNIEPGEKIILTSDGIHDNLTDREIGEIIENTPASGDATNALIEAAANRSRDKEHLRHKPDDMSAVVMVFEKV